MNDYCADDHKHVVLVSIKMSERKRNTVKYQLGKVNSARAFGLPKWLVNRTGH